MSTCQGIYFHTIDVGHFYFNHGRKCLKFDFSEESNQNYLQWDDLDKSNHNYQIHNNLIRVDKPRNLKDYTKGFTVKSVMFNFGEKDRSDTDSMIMLMQN